MTETHKIESFNPLGANARKMLGIGIIQDKLVDMEFEFELKSSEYDLHSISSMRDKNYHNHIVFWSKFVYHNGIEYSYDSDNWGDLLINAVNLRLNIKYN